MVLSSNRIASKFGHSFFSIPYTIYAQTLSNMNKSVLPNILSYSYTLLALLGYSFSMLIEFLDMLIAVNL